MHAIVLHTFGPPEQLRHEEVLDPTSGSGQVVIDVAAAGVHLVDTLIRAGTAVGPFPLPELPFVPGREVEGTVTEVGDAVDRAWLGRRVTAHLGAASGGYAERVAVSEEALLAVPDGLEVGAAVALLGTGRTTMAILDAATIGPDDVVLVTAAAGGIGGLLVRAARHRDIPVVGLAGGPRKTEVVAAAGAEAVDYLADGWTDRVRERLDGEAATVLLDGVGGPLGDAALDLVDAGGRVVLFGSSAGRPTAVTAEMVMAKGLTVTSPLGPKLARRPEVLRALARRALDAAAEGWFTPTIGQRFALADAPAAHHAVAGRDTIGKTVLWP